MSITGIMQKFVFFKNSLYFKEFGFGLGIPIFIFVYDSIISNR